MARGIVVRADEPVVVSREAWFLGLISRLVRRLAGAPGAYVDVYNDPARLSDNHVRSLVDLAAGLSLKQGARVRGVPYENYRQWRRHAFRRLGVRGPEDFMSRVLRVLGEEMGHAP